MATLAELRGKLNGELGVDNDADTVPWSPTVRNNAISDGYAALWTAGVWRAVTEDFATVSSQSVYNLTTIRRIARLELRDSTGVRIGKVAGVAAPSGVASGSHLRLATTYSDGATLRAYGWTAYISAFGQNDAAVDDLPAEYNRIPLLKAKAILYRAALGSFARYGSKQAAPPEMNLTAESLLAIVAAAEREFAEEAHKLSSLRPRSGQARWAG